MLFMLAISITYPQPTLEVEGSIKIGNNTDPNPKLGSMRWTGSDFEVWNGVIWASLTGNKEVGTMQDIDGNTYQTIRIGNQEWMVENLRVTKYRNNTVIDQITNVTTWSGLTTGAWCYWDNSSSNNITYGKLYNWYAVTDGSGLCPTGWHVPSDGEWTTLTDYLGGMSIAGGKMKEEGTTHWSSPNAGATNESGFSGLPGGFRTSNGTFYNLGNIGYWWSSTESGANAWYRYLSYNDVNVNRSNLDERLGFSVRCLRN